MKRVITTNQSSTGRNLNFKDTKSSRYMTRQDFVRSIKAGNYENYHVRLINGIETPVSNPDKSKNNNLD